MKQQKDLFVKYGFSDKEMKTEARRYEKLQRAIEKKELKSFEKELKRFSGREEKGLF